MIYAEAVLKGGTGGDAATALTYINRLRGRAYANDPASTAGNITAGQLTFDLYWMKEDVNYIMKRIEERI